MADNGPPVATRRGDDGTTTLLGSGRIKKDDPRVVLLGDIDEASAFLGVARAETTTGGELDKLLLELQRLLYRIMGDIAMPKEPNYVGEKDVKLIDDRLEAWKARTEIPREFVVPGESRLGSLLDVARSVVRRAERSAVAVDFTQTHPHAAAAINRLSDLLFVVARNADGESPRAKG